MTEVILVYLHPAFPPGRGARTWKVLQVKLQMMKTHVGEVFVPGSDPEGPVAAPVSEDHALGDGVAVDEALVSLLLEARRVPAPLHHFDGHLGDCELVPVGHL